MRLSIIANLNRQIQIRQQEMEAALLGLQDEYHPATEFQLMDKMKVDRGQAVMEAKHGAVSG